MKQTKVYKNQNRIESNGTQKEKPFMHFQNGLYKIDGYQKFEINKNILNYIGPYKNKFNFIYKFIVNVKNECTSITDIGASNGAIAFMAARSGYKKVYALDHDKECVDVIYRLKNALNMDNICAKIYSFGEPHPATDIVIATALIHWVYSCTALFGNFDKIISLLRNMSLRYLLIEWVDPQDLAIRSFKHTSFNKSIITEEYNKNNFIKTLEKYFRKTEKVYNCNKTRELYLCHV